MINAQNNYPFVALNPTSLTAGATGTSSVIDTIQNGQKMDYLTLYYIASTANVVSNVPTVLEVLTADVTASSSFNAIAAFTGGSAAGNFAIPTTMSTATSNGVYCVMNIDVRSYGRYFEAKVSPQTTQTWTILALLSRAHQFPVGDVTPANQNAAIVVTG